MENEINNELFPTSLQPVQVSMFCLPKTPHQKRRIENEAVKN